MLQFSSICSSAIVISIVPIPRWNHRPCAMLHYSERQSDVLPHQSCVQHPWWVDTGNVERDKLDLGAGHQRSSCRRASCRPSSICRCREMVLHISYTMVRYCVHRLSIPLEHRGQGLHECYHRLNGRIDESRPGGEQALDNVTIRTTFFEQ